MIMDVKKVVLVTLLIDLPAGLCFVICSFVASNKCYLKQIDGACVQGSGIDVLFKVSHGTSFQVIITGFLFVCGSGMSIAYLIVVPIA